MYTYYNDPGHGWVKVRTAQLIKLGIEDQISEYSYFSPDGLYSYLEEDCDAGVFISALGHTPKFREVYQENTPIRDYPPYDPNWVRQHKLALLALEE